MSERHKAHSDPDNSGKCIYCGFILDVLDEEDEAFNRQLVAEGKACGSETSIQEDSS